jgi:hypothetical protein
LEIDVTAASTADLQTALLKVLANPSTDKRLGRGQYYLGQEVFKELAATEINYTKLMEAIWALVAQGLAYIDFWQPAPENWQLRLTEAGANAATT